MGDGSQSEHEGARDVPARFMSVCTAALAVIGVVYVGAGFVNLLGLFGTEGAGDLLKRWVEHAYFVRGMSPLDVYSGASPPDPEIGPMHAGSYPPWSLLTGLIFAPPINQTLLRWYAAALNLAALTAMLTYAYRLGRPYGTGPARLFAAATCAIVANAITLRFGQYGIIVNVLIIGTLLAHASGRPGWGGLLLGIAALKPQTSGLFSLIWLNKRGIPALAVAAAWVLGTALLGAAWLGRSPLTLLRQVYEQAAVWDGGDNGLLGVFLAWGLPRTPVSLALLVAGLGGSAILLVRHRSDSLLTRTAILCVMGRLWMYHRRYDDMMLVFLLLALAIAAIELGTTTSWIPFGLVGTTLWLPLRESDHTPPVVLAKAIVWLGALAWLVRRAPARESSERSEAVGQPRGAELHDGESSA